ncbi:hypothetical protein TNCV_3834401 [Trichonephila clavipes]|nr:hypothetical protein TNCV_3834401 [Trichonephila clavipes]
MLQERLKLALSGIQPLWDEWEFKNCVSRRHVPHRSIMSYNTCGRLFPSSFRLNQKNNDASARCRSFCPIRNKNLHYKGASLHIKRPVLGVPQAIDRDVPLYIGQRNTFPGPDTISKTVLTFFLRNHR